MSIMSIPIPMSTPMSMSTPTPIPIPVLPPKPKTKPTSKLKPTPTQEANTPLWPSTWALWAGRNDTTWTSTTATQWLTTWDVI